jgi:hypothetical protein
MADDMMPYVSVAAAAKILRVTPQRVYQLLESGALAGKRSGETRMVGIGSVKARIAKLEARSHLRLEL